MSDAGSRGSIKLPGDFFFREVHTDQKVAHPAPLPAPLGPLAAFVGDWVGNGFNTIFRPNNTATPTPLPNPLPPGDNILELNLTSESLSFSPSLDSVPNRGDDAARRHFPQRSALSADHQRHYDPRRKCRYPRRAGNLDSCAGDERATRRGNGRTHGVDPARDYHRGARHLCVVAGPPTINPVDITPFQTSNPANKIKFVSQTATNPNTPRIPQDLSSFIAAGTITQPLLDDPNGLLRSHISKQKITNTIALIISTGPPPPPPPVPFGGGTDNIAFLLGQSAATAPNAQALQMTAIFWIETVEEVILVPPFNVGGPPFAIKAKPSVPGQLVPTFSVTPPFDLDMPREITVHFTQIQYTQTVLLNFAGLTWPHVSVNTLVPADDIVVPPSVWS